MATSVTKIAGQLPEGTDAWFRLLWTNDAGVMLVQSDVSAIDLKVYLGDSTTALYTAPALTYTPAANMFNTAQTDGWTIGGVGYDMKARVPASATALDGGRLYNFEWILTLSGGNGIASHKIPVEVIGRLSQ